MTANSVSNLNENRISLVQKSIESLYNIQDRELLIKEMLTVTSYLIGEGKVYLLVYDKIAKGFIPYVNDGSDRVEAKELIQTIEKHRLHKKTDTDYVVHQGYWFFPYQENNTFSGTLVISPANGPLSEEMISMLGIFMQSVPILLENSRLYLLMKRKTKSLTFMGQLHELVNQYSFQEILEEIVEKVGEILDTEMAGVMLYEPNENELRLQKPAFGIWDESMIDQYRIPIRDTGNAKNVFMTGIPSITNNAYQAVGYNQKIVRLFKAKSIITAPLTVEDKRIGVLHAINKKDEKFFTQVDVQSLMELSEQLGTLIQGALQLSRQKPQQQKRQEIERFLAEQLVELLIDHPEKMSEIEKISSTLRFDLSGYKSVLLIGGVEKQQLAQMEAVIRRKISEAFPFSLMVYRDDHFCVIVPHEKKADIAKASERLRNEFIKALRKKSGKHRSFNIYIGIGDSVTSYKDICHSHQQAKQILNILPKINKSIGYYPQLGNWTLLSYVAGNEDITFPFVDHHLKKINEMKDVSLMKETLEAYLRNNGQLNKTAEELFIHPNTLKYRVAKLEDVAGFDLADAEIRLNLNLALRLEKMLDS